MENLKYNKKWYIIENNKEGESAMVGIIIVIVCLMTYVIYDAMYFTSERFMELKNIVKDRVQDCIALNHHIEELRGTYIKLSKLECEYSIYTDSSQSRERKKEPVYTGSFYIYDFGIFAYPI